MEAPALGTLPRVALFSAKATVSLSAQSREVTKLARQPWWLIPPLLQEAGAGTLELGECTSWQS